MKKLNKTDLMCIFLTFHPLLDLLTSMMTRFEIGFVSIGVIVRSIFIFIMLIYLFFYNNSKYKIKSIFYIFLIILFCLFYFITKIELVTNLSFFFDEAIYLFKYLYLPITFITLINYCDQYKVDKRKIINSFVISLALYAILLVIPYLTNTSFKSYQHKQTHLGLIGWFYSANEVSAILAMLFPLLFLYIDKKNDVRLIFIFLITLFASIIIGTKLAFFGSIITMCIILFYYLVNNKKYNWKNYLLVGSFLIIMILFSFNLPVVSNIKESINKYTKVEVVEKDQNIENTEKVNVEEATTIILSSRNKLVKRLYNIYKERPIIEKLFGIGFSNRESINNKYIERNVEMDFFEVFLRYGLIGFILYISLFVYIGFKVLIYLIKSRFSLNIEKLIFLLVTCYGFGTAFLVGHVFGAPPVSIYLAFMCVFCLDTLSIKKVKHLNKDKVTFLCLHLGTGGIERATINTANALVKEKEVTIISFYKLSDEKYYDIDPRVKIKYLYHGKPNKKEWIESLKGINNESFFKHSYIAAKILISKYLLMIREIKKIKEGIILSTRVEFSLLLNYYGNDNVVKVAVEHTYHNNDKKYLNKMKYGYGNIDYLVVLTEKLKTDYEEMFKENNKIKILIIENMLTTFKRKASKLTNKKIITNGRLHPGKRINEMIDIAKEFKGSGWTFEVIGEGTEEQSLKKQIKDLKLEKTFHLLGTFPNDEVIKTLSESSIFIMTSISEGFAISLVEAISVGLPVIAYETENGITDIVDNNVEGYIIKDRNKEEFIEKLKYLMNNLEERKRISKNSLEKSKLYTNEAISQKWLNFINGTILK